MAISSENGETVKASEFWVTFTSTLPLEDPENPHPKGYAIAKRLYYGLGRSDVQREEIDNWRDVGYSIDCVIDGARVYLFFSLLRHSVQQWALCCTSDLSWLSRLLGKSDGEQRLKLARAVDAVLRGSHEFSDVRWYKQWHGAEDASWTDQPE